MRTRISAVDNVSDVGEARAEKDRGYDERYAENARRLLEEFTAESGGQRAAAKKLGISQSALSRALVPPGQPTLRILIALRKFRPLLIDEMLGLPPILDVLKLPDSELRERLASLLQLLGPPKRSR